MKKAADCISMKRGIRKPIIFNIISENILLNFAIGKPERILVAIEITNEHELTYIKTEIKISENNVKKTQKIEQ
jgi:hypothetical protein